MMGSRRLRIATGSSPEFCSTFTSPAPDGFHIYVFAGLKSNVLSCSTLILTFAASTVTATNALITRMRSRPARLVVVSISLLQPMNLLCQQAPCHSKLLGIARVSLCRTRSKAPCGPRYFVAKSYQGRSSSCPGGRQLMWSGFDPEILRDLQTIRQLVKLTHQTPIREWPLLFVDREDALFVIREWPDGSLTAYLVPVSSDSGS